MAGRAVAYGALAPPPLSCPAVLPTRPPRHIARSLGEPGLGLVHMVPQNTSRLPPRPTMSTDGRLAAECRRRRRLGREGMHNWEFCDGWPLQERSRLRCVSASFLTFVDCSWIDPDTKESIKPGLVFTDTSSYPTQLSSGERGMPVTLPLAASFVRVPELARVVGVYPTAPAHIAEEWPRLVHLVAMLPGRVPLLVPRHRLNVEFAQILDVILEAGCALDQDDCRADGDVLARQLAHGSSPPGHRRGPVSRRILWWEKGTWYHAHRVFFSWEGALDDRSGRWDLMLTEDICSSRRTQAAWRLQRFVGRRFLRPSHRPAEGGRRPRILVVHRADARSRKLLNNAQLVEALARTFHVDVFVGADRSLAQTIASFVNADAVVAPHGAANSFWAFLQPGTAVVEVGYPGHGGQWFPPAFYYYLAVANGLQYGLSMALTGSYSSALVANITDVVLVIKRALGPLGLGEGVASRSRPVKGHGPKPLPV